MATGVFTPVGKIGGGSIPIARGKLKTSTAVAKGDLLVNDAGYLKPIATTGTEIVGVSTQTIASTVAVQDLDYVPVSADMIFQGPTSADITIANVNTNYGVTCGTAAQNILLTETSTVSAKIIGLVYNGLTQDADAALVVFIEGAFGYAV